MTPAYMRTVTTCCYGQSRLAVAAHSRRTRRTRSCTVASIVERDSRQLAKTKAMRPVLSLLSACVEVNDQVRLFELLAGRSAMIGFLVALGVEGITEKSVFSQLGEQDITLLCAVCLACTLSASILASMSTRRLGLQLQESVMSSLTAVKRSAASVTQQQVDKAVDYMIDQFWDRDLLYTTLLDDDWL